MGNLFKLLYENFHLYQGGDQALWKLTKNEIFEVCSYYNALRGFTCQSFP